MTTEGQTGEFPLGEHMSPTNDQGCVEDGTEDGGNNSTNDGTQNGNTQPSQTSGLSLLLEWANKQDHWIRKIVYNVVQTRSQLSDDQITEAYELLLREKQLVEGTPPDVKLLSSSQTSVSTSTAMKLNSLKHVENVNALTADQEIEFHPRLTVCFGENGSGKTGYVRILKQAASVRTAQPVLPNIHKTGHEGTPWARIKVAYGDEERTIDWHGESGLEPLTRLVVFDARAALVHINDDLTYSYTPADLSLFPLVTDGIERVQERLQTAKEEKEPSGNPADNHFSRESKLYEKVKNLGGSNGFSEIRSLAEVSDEEEANLPTLREKVAALSSGTVRQQINAANQESNVLSKVLLIGRALLDFDTVAYSEAIAALSTARANHDQATREALAGEAIPGILSKPWQEFVEAAEAYIKEVGLDPYPESDASCIYCRQPLGDAAIGLIQKYRDYCNAALRQEVEQANANLRNLSTSVSNLLLDENERDVDRILEAVADPDSPPPTLTAAREVIRQARLFQQVLATEGDCPPMPESMQHMVGAVRAGAEAAKITSDDLSKQGGERERVLEEEQARLSELEERLTLRGMLPVMRNYVEAMKWVDRCSSYLQRFPAIKRGLTDTSKRASTEVINSRFEKLFQEECQSLHAPKVKLDFPGREGQARRRKILTSEHDLSEILSEGEQKVIALADFLSEAALNPDGSPIVLDDPVTSLDHKRLQHVVDRLVELSITRQIIVFTHDIWFAAELLARFERTPKECAFYDVTAVGERIGLALRGSHPRTDTFSDRGRQINARIEQANNETGENLRALIEKGYEELRGACEVVVEKDLLKGVTERYRPNVRMTVLDQIRGDRLPDAVQKIVPIFDKSCRIIASHSQPLVTLGIRPTLLELKEDWQALQDARKEYLQN